MDESKLSQKSADLIAQARERVVLELTDALEEQKRLVDLVMHRFESVFEGIPVACFTVDQHGLVYESNPAATHFIGFEPFELLGLPAFGRLMTESSEAEFLGIIARVFQGERLQGIETRISCRDGSRPWVIMSCFPMKGPNHQICGAMFACVDITARVEAENLLEIQRVAMAKQARTDALTGLANRRQFDLILGSMLNDVNLPICLIMLDLDDFKTYNDQFGHVAGDAALVLVGKILSEMAPVGGLAIRYGGEEFAVLISGRSLDWCVNITENIKDSIARASFPHRSITVSAGVAERPVGESTREQFVELADSALYQAKALGRNQVCRFAGSESSAA